MEIIEFEGTLARHYCEETLIAKITEKVLAIPNYGKMKYDVQLVMYIANVLENELGDKKTKEEKHALVKAVLLPIFSYDGNDLGIVQNQLHFLDDNKKVKKLKTSSYVIRSCGKWFAKKIL